MKAIGFKALVGLGDDDILHEWCEEEQLEQVENLWPDVRRIRNPCLQTASSSHSSEATSRVLPLDKNPICVLIGSGDVFRSRSVVVVDHVTIHKVGNNCQIVPLHCSTRHSCCIHNSMQFIWHVLLFIIIVVVCVVVSICVFVAWLLCLFLCCGYNWNIKEVSFVAFGDHLDESLDCPAFKAFLKISMRGGGGGGVEDYHQFGFTTDGTTSSVQNNKLH